MMTSVLVKSYSSVITYDCLLDLSTGAFGCLSKLYPLDSGMVKIIMNNSIMA